MGVVRFVWNVILAVLLVALVIVVLGTGLGLVAARSWETEGLDDGRAEATWLWLEGRPIDYQDQGNHDALCVVLVHGHSPEGLEVWADNRTALARSGLRVVSVDLSGYGRSDRATEPVYSVREQAELLASVLNNLQVRDAIVVAHDWGSAVALQMALDQPQFVQQLVLVAPRLELESELAWRMALKVPYVRRAALWARWGGGPLMDLERRAQFADEDMVTAEYLQGVRSYTHIDGHLAALEAMVATPADSDLPSALDQVRVPVLVLVGDEDAVASEAAVAAWAGRLHSVEVEVIAGAGHYPQVEQSSAVNQRLLALGADLRTP